jgi:hypothetical protein
MKACSQHAQDDQGRSSSHNTMIILVLCSAGRTHKMSNPYMHRHDDLMPSWLTILNETLQAMTSPIAGLGLKGPVEFHRHYYKLAQVYQITSQDRHRGRGLPPRVRTKEGYITSTSRPSLQHHSSSAQLTPNSNNKLDNNPFHSSQCHFPPRLSDATALRSTA